MPPNNLLSQIQLSKQEANVFLSRKVLANSWHHFEEIKPGNLEKECLEEQCSWEEAREVFETDRDGLDKFWAQYTGQTDNSSVDSPVGMIVGIVFGIAGLIILSILAFVIWRRKSRPVVVVHSGPNDRYPNLQNHQKQGLPVNNYYETPLLDKFDSELAMGLSECYVERERLQLGEVITSGNFGDIWKGKLRMRDNSVVKVAVKSLKQLDEPDDIEKFLREGVMMRGLNHKHVLSLYGVCMDSDVERHRTSPLIILPFMKNGDLRTFLRDGGNVLTVLHLIRFCNHVALGMEYLAQKKFVHRDLAARNCMVNENWCVKVADFGLSRDLYDRDYYRSSIKTQLPLKWMSPESIKYGRYGEKTDVWSYGVVCWEIMTRGAIPYPTIQSANILEYLNEGKRMEKPECCPYKLYSVMGKCWNDDADLRPTFEDLVKLLSGILRNAKESLRKSKQSSDDARNRTELHLYENQPELTASERKPKSKPRSAQKAASADKGSTKSGKRKVLDRRANRSESDNSEPSVSV